MSNTVSLILIDRDGGPRGYDGDLPEVTAEVIQETVKHYDSVGFEQPWVGYLALSGSTPVGTCGFKSPPQDRRVEITRRATSSGPTDSKPRARPW